MSIQKYNPQFTLTGMVFLRYIVNMDMKRFTLLPLALLLFVSAGCAARAAADPVSAQTPPPQAQMAEEERSRSAGGVVRLAGEETEITGAASYDNGLVTVPSPGTYYISGSLAGQVAITAEGPVELVLAGAHITAPAGESAIYTLSDDAALTITLAAGTENTLSDGAASPDAASQAAVYTEGPLTIGGEGALTVSGGANNGMQSKGALTVTGGSLTVTAANHAMKSRGALTVSGGTLVLTAGNDGLCAEDGRLDPGDVTVTGGDVTIHASGRGIDGDGAVELAGGIVLLASAEDGIRGNTVTLAGTSLSIDAGGDGVQGASALTVTGGAISIITAGGGGSAIDHAGEMMGGPGPMGSQEADDNLTLDVSAKGLKSDGDITVTGGTLDLNTADDAVHAGGSCRIDDGTLIICSNDDGIHADAGLVINGGDIDLNDCFEGLEAYTIDVNGGDILIRSVNDGINANGPEMMFGGPGGFGGSTSADTAETYFRQTGGVIDLAVTGNMSNLGDGVDSNGAVYIEGGVLLVSTVGSTMENGIDTGGTLRIDGGIVVAGGSATMMEGVSADSAQCAATLNTGSVAGGTEITVTDGEGNVILSATLQNTFSSLILSHPDMLPGNVYTVTYGTGSATLDFTSSTVINNSSFGFGFGGPGGFGQP